MKIAILTTKPEDPSMIAAVEDFLACGHVLSVEPTKADKIIVTEELVSRLWIVSAGPRPEQYSGWRNLVYRHLFTD